MATMTKQQIEENYKIYFNGEKADPAIVDWVYKLLIDTSGDYLVPDSMKEDW